MRPAKIWKIIMTVILSVFQTLKARWKKMLSPKLTEYEKCLEIQNKIRNQKKPSIKLKSELDGEARPVSRKN